MSNKPLKKSDLKKSWMKPRRDRSTTIAPEYHLIVTEGTKTEPEYFEGLKKEINRNYPNRISITIQGIGQGVNTITLSNENITYHALWSNQCIEYWFLLHFMHLQSDLHRDEYYPKLTEWLGSKYEKNRKDIYGLLKPHLETAIFNAKKVLSCYDEVKIPSRCTPGTTVYEIFEKLQHYFDFS